MDAANREYGIGKKVRRIAKDRSLPPSVVVLARKLIDTWFAEYRSIRSPLLATRGSSPQRVPQPERLVQSDGQPWAQHGNSREISAESLSALEPALYLQ